MSADVAPLLPGGRRRRLGEVLVADGAITEADLERALVAQRAGTGGRQRLGRLLQELGLVNERAIAAALARQLNLSQVSLEDRPTPPLGVVERVPRHVATQHNLLPMAFDEFNGMLTVAMSDPTNVVALDDLRSVANTSNVLVVVATESSLERAITRAYEQGAADLAVLAFDADDDTAFDDADEEPVVRLVNAVIADAVRARASDVHVEPGRAAMRVRVRIDGLLRETQTVPQRLSRAVTSRLKVMAHIDIAERRLPQDGRAVVHVDGEEVDLRVSTMPSLYGEKVVLRLLRKGGERLDVDDLGLDERQHRAFLRAIRRPQGMVLLTGPTGSGKTTTLYAGLERLATPERNVASLEDPIEYELDGINQSQVHAKIGMTFARGLRTVLRQDPDVIMLGEIRDTETAKLAVEASVTGHLLLSTLHTSDAPSTIARLTELGVDRFLLATTLSLVVAQRLGRRVCDACAVPDQPDPVVLEDLGLTMADLAAATPRRGVGCGLCDDTGVRGRVGLYEFLEVTPRLRQLVSDGGTELQLAALARAEGMRSLRQDGLDKALRGVLTLDEVLRITPDDQFQALELDGVLAEAGAVHASAPPVTVPTTGGPAAPAVAGAAAPAPTPATQPSRDAVRRGQAAALAVRTGAVDVGRLLVVGDAWLSETAAASLPPGWRMTTAASVADALLFAGRERPDVLLVSDAIDGGSAIDVVQGLRDVGHADAAVVLHTDEPLRGTHLVDVTALGVVDRVHGTVDPPTLRARLEAALRH